MTISRKQMLLLLSLVALLLSGSSSKAMAFTFTPVLPAICPNFTEVDFSYSVSNSEWELATDLQGHYLNRNNHTRQLTANGYVDAFGVRLDFLDLENNFDKLTYSSPFFSGTSTGTGPLGWIDLDQRDISFQGSSSSINFSTDFSVTQGGFKFGRARACARDSLLAGSQVRYVLPGVRQMGLLLGTDDVVYMQVPVGSTKSGESCSKAHDTFALWGQIGATNDFDMFVRCNALPTPTAFTYSARSSDNQEFIHATSADCPCGGTWNIAIHSFRGAGQFNFVPSKHYKHYAKHSVGIMCDLNATDFASRVDRTREGFKTWYGATEGGWYWDGIDVYDKASFFPNTGSTRWECAGGRAHSPICNAATPFYLFSSEANPGGGKTMAHEMGHYYGCVRDEYADGKGSRDQHSMMASQWITTDMCYCDNWGNGSPDSSQENGCQDGHGNHDRDADPLWGSPAPASGRSPVWKKWYDESYIPFPVTSTPDAFDYVPFDFNGLYPVINQFNN